MTRDRMEANSERKENEESISDQEKSKRLERQGRIMTRSRTEADRKRKENEESTSDKEKSMRLEGQGRIMTRSRTEADRKKKENEEATAGSAGMEKNLALEKQGIMTKRGENRQRRKLSTTKKDKGKSIILEQQDNKTNTQLLPGICDDVTLEVISTVLPWNVFPILSSVCTGWQDAVESRKIYDVRVGSHSRETLVVVNHALCKCSRALDLYSLREKGCHQLPPIPQVKGGIPQFCECITLDGKIYILGGSKASDLKLATEEVHVFDLAGKRQWKRCASMLVPRYQFDCQVINGKIYVFGGASPHALALGSEMYDPEVDAWTEIFPMPFLKFGHEVGRLGEELLVSDGKLYYPQYWALQAQYRKTKNNRMIDCLEAYDHVKDKWGTVAENIDIRTHPDDEFDNRLCLQIALEFGEQYIRRRRKIAWDDSACKIFL